MTPVETEPGLSPTESVILSAARSTLRRPLSPADVSAPLSILGADSLGMIELVAAVEDAAGIEVPADVAHESITIRELASWIDAAPRARRNGASPDPFEQMLLDSELPRDLQPGPAQSSMRLLDARAILLTGATGFLGGQLAADLLASSNALLYCIVRQGRDEPEARLRRKLIEHGAGPQDIAARVRTVEADLNRPFIGLGRADWERLGSAVDRVLHVGASVNWIASYGALRTANVGGTLELLRLACRPASIPFHFVSSLSVCYSADGPSSADEAFDPLPYLRGIHLGYAQTKVVAETLVREAGRRGLPVKIYRPSLISGHSRTGAFNPDDLLSLLIRGCLRMGAAPDLDWALDCEPVDVVSAEILSLSGQTDQSTMHLSHVKPRHWRECLVWMRLTGHAVRLVPYSEWLKLLDDETSKLLDHPLRPLRAFFLNRPARGLTLPELYEDVRRTRTINVRTSARLSTAIQRPALDASLLNRYFCAYRAAGYIAHSGGRSEEEPEPTIPGMPDMSGMDEAFFETALAARGHAVRVRTATRTAIGSEHSIISELTAWRSRRPAGLFRYRLELEANGRPRVSDVVVKIKPHADDGMAVGEAMARLCDVRVGEAFSRWRERTGLAGSHLRERAIYECGDERLTGCMPALLGALELDDLGACALVMEDVSGALLMDSIDRVPSWRPEHIEVVVRDLASLHAVWYGRATEIERRPWIGFVQSTESMRRMSDLWSALADHSASAFARWAGPDIPRIHRELVGSIEDWYPAIEAGPQALVHNDFNPRNICLRERAGALSLCAYDWELATLSTPQRDLAELLCFVLPATARGADIDGWIERHRAGLSAAAGVSIDPDGWLTGFHAAMNELLIDRLAMYALVHRVKRQPFLPRVLATWRRIHQHVVEHTR